MMIKARVLLVVFTTDVLRVSLLTADGEVLLKDITEKRLMLISSVKYNDPQ